MQFKRILSLVLALSLSLVLAACGGASNTAGEATEAASGGETSETGGSSADLPESASVTVATGGTLTVNYPSGWTATPTDGTGVIAFVGSEATQVVGVTFLPEAMGADAAAVLDMQASALAAAGTASEVTTTDNGAYMTVTVAGMETTYFVGAIDGGYVYVTGAGVEASVLEAIAASASFSN